MLPNLGPMEMMVVGVVAVLLFGRRLPEVGRSLGKGIVEFKKGIRGIEDDVDTTPTRSSLASEGALLLQRDGLGPQRSQVRAPDLRPRGRLKQQRPLPGLKPASRARQNESSSNFGGDALRAHRRRQLARHGVRLYAEVESAPFFEVTVSDLGQ